MDTDESLFIAGTKSLQEGRLEEAAGYYRQVLSINPRHVGTLNNLGGILTQLGKLTPAIELFQQGLKMNPTMAEIQNNLGSLFKAQGRLDEALACFRKALELRPDFHLAANNLLFVMNYHQALTPDQVFQEHKRWGESLRRPPSIVPPTNDPQPDRRLRIGYVSPDFRRHSVAYSIEPIVRHHDKDQFEVFCYAEVRVPDETTARIKKTASVWRDTCGLSDEEVSDRIRKDKIDILLELSGHTTNNRLPVFVHRPAPIQISFQGYPNTTGLKEFDYRIGDPWADPAGNEKFFVEKLIRLPNGFLCYDPGPAIPEVAPLPALKNNHVTFGSFNELAKTTPQVIQLWSRILKKVPGSRLVLKCHAFADPETSKRYARLLEQEAIERPRFELIGWTRGRQDHLNLYGRIDIGLDPFPYNGTTTTCEALWMGVPVITLEGQSHVSRVGFSMMKRLGLNEWIARNEEEYVNAAVKFAGDVKGLSNLRATLRPTFQNSSLCRMDEFVGQLEDLYRMVWRKWCL